MVTEFLKGQVSFHSPNISSFLSGESSTPLLWIYPTVRHLSCFQDACSIPRFIFWGRSSSNFGVKKSTPDGTVMDFCMMFSDIVSQISGARETIVAEFFLSFLTADPVELRLNGIESPACNGVGYGVKCCCVIGLHRSWGLLVSHFFEVMACWDVFATVY